MKIDKIETKILIPPDEEGEITFSIKVEVENNSDDEEIQFELQGIDSDGFAIYDLLIDGHIPIGESRTMTDIEKYVDVGVFNKIVKWQGK